MQKRMKQIWGSNMNSLRTNHGVKHNFPFSWENKKMPLLWSELTSVKDLFHSVSCFWDSSLFLHVSVAQSFSLLSSSPLYGYIPIYLLIFFYIAVYSFFSFLAIPIPCGILVPQPGIELGPSAVNCRVLTTGPPGKSLFIDSYIDRYLDKFSFLLQEEITYGYFHHKLFLKQSFNFLRQIPRHELLIYNFWYMY